MINTTVDFQKELEDNKNFKNELTALLNKYNKHSVTDTPDFLLSEYLIDCVNSYNRLCHASDIWQGTVKNKSVNV